MPAGHYETPSAVRLPPEPLLSLTGGELLPGQPGPARTARPCPVTRKEGRGQRGQLQQRGQAAAARCDVARCLPVSAATRRFVSDCTGGRPLMSSVLVVSSDMIVSVSTPERGVSSGVASTITEPVPMSVIHANAPYSCGLRAAEIHILCCARDPHAHAAYCAQLRRYAAVLQGRCFLDGILSSDPRRSLAGRLRRPGSGSQSGCRAGLRPAGKPLAWLVHQTVA